MHNQLKTHLFLSCVPSNNTIVCSLCAYVLSNDKLNVGIEVPSNGFASSKGFDGYNKFNEYVDGHIKSKTHKQSVIRLTNINCAKDTNVRIMGNLSSIARLEYVENQQFLRLVFITMRVIAAQGLALREHEE